MEQREFGNTGMTVSAVGFGGAEIGFERKAAGDAHIEELLNGILDLGITLVDTAECYDDSEELIGRFIGHRRDEYTLTTKIGHSTNKGSAEDWDIPMLEQTVDRGLKRLQTDRVDVIQLHTCSLEMLQQGDVVSVLQRAKEAGKTRFIGYSGDNEAVDYAATMGVFDSIQTSFSIVEQRGRKGLFQAATDAGLGIIAKRPIGNAVVGAKAPNSDYAKPYFERAQKIQWPDYDLDPIELSLRYTLSFPISTAIVGSKNFSNIRKNIALADKGPLPKDLLAKLNDAYDAADEGWRQES